MRKPFLIIDKQLKHLMETHNPPIKSARKLSRLMHEAGVLEYSDTPGVTKEESINHQGSSINNHLHGKHIEYGWLKAYCTFFGCSADYLLGYIPEPTHELTDIAKATGLSEAAIEKLKYLHSAPGGSGIMEALNTILTSVNFENALDHVGEYLEKSRLCHSLKENQIQNQYYSDEAQKMECQKYEASTHFSYTLDEIGSTPERRQRIFEAGMSGLFD